LMFVLVKLFPLELAHRFTWIGWLFLAFWVGYTIYAYFNENYFKINRHALLMAAGLGLLVPICNGLQGGLWPWRAFALGYWDSLYVDLAWFFAGAVTLYVALQLRPRPEKATGKPASRPQQLVKTKPLISAANPGGEL
ncbi:MAG: hypothetical protein AAF804_18370, partial [Bacteroidota bacterium]